MEHSSGDAAGDLVTTELIIHVVLGNDAMETASQAVSAIQQAILTQHPEPFSPMEPADAGVVLDMNGNTVGRWIVEGAS